MNISKNGLNLIKEFEGFSSKPYLDVVNIPTIGWGNTFYEDGTKVKLGEQISKTDALKLLEHIANKDFGNFVNKTVKVPLNQNQFDALVSFAYNLGNGSLQNSTLLKKLNSGDYQGASNEFLRWNKSGGKVLNGLTRRREKERALFLS